MQFAALYAARAEAELRWPLAEKNLHHVAARIDPDATLRAAHQVNAWLARTHWRGPDSVANEVQELRTTSCLPPSHWRA